MLSEDELITARVTEITEHRAVIEQAKGMLMLVYGLDAGAAFDLLKWRSQKSNTKLRTLAEQLIHEFRDVREQAITARSPFDHVLLTSRARAARGGDEVPPPTAN